MCFVPGLVFPEGGSLSKFVDFPMVKNILALPQRLFGFHSTQNLRYRASRPKPFKLTRWSFASLNLVQIWQIQSKTTYIMFTICKKNMSFSFIKQQTNYFVTFLLLASICAVVRGIVKHVKARQKSEQSISSRDELKKIKFVQWTVSTCPLQNFINIYKRFHHKCLLCVPVRFKQTKWLKFLNCAQSFASFIKMSIL